MTTSPSEIEAVLDKLISPYDSNDDLSFEMIGRSLWNHLDDIKLAVKSARQVEVLREALKEARQYSLGSSGEDCIIYKILDEALLAAEGVGS